MRARRGADRRGASLADLVVGLAILGIVVAAAVPGWAGWRDRQALWRSVGRLRLDVASLTALAARDGRARGLLLAFEGEGLCWTRVVDGDADGIRRTDLSTGADRAEGPPFCLSDVGGGVTRAVGPGGPAAGPGGSVIPADGVAVPGDLLSITPTGGGSSGTVYLAGRSGEVVALRRYGPTGRIRVWRYRPDKGIWTPL